ncbi:MAG: hypothetical protein H7X97_07610 [Opitutaceae bacterium]|nr:hypothetical protein [Verrucomicrobiales bacterium]
MTANLPLKSLLLSCLAFTATAAASTINYVDFSSVSGLTLNGSTAQAGNVLRLTPANTGQSGSAFSTTTVGLNNLNSFSTRFQFRISGSGGIGDGDGAGADGLVFVVQTVGNNVGGSGGGIGYQGINSSVGIEFDTYNNGPWDDFNNNHVGIDLNGNIDSVVQTGISPRFNDGNIWTSWVDYDGTTNSLEVRVNQTGVRPVLSTLSYTVNLAGVLGTTNAYVGFTSGTGSGYGNHDILNWELDSDYAPIGNVPDTASTLPLLFIGLAGLSWLRRTRVG